MAANFELPSTLRHALSAFAFTGKTLWTMSEGRRNVKIEITLLLQDRDPQPTNKRARAVPAPAAKPRRQQPAQPQRETPPPTSDVIASQPATVTLQRPASPARATPSPIVQPPPSKKKKLIRSSTPRNLPPTPQMPMEVSSKPPQDLPSFEDLSDPSPAVDLNAATIETPMSRPEVLPPEVAARRVGPPTITYRYWKSVPVDHKKWQAKHKIMIGKFWRHEHPIDGTQIIFECCKAKDKWRDQKKHYVLWYQRDENYRWFTPPGFEHHIPEWWTWLSSIQKQPPTTPAERLHGLAAFDQQEGQFFQAVPCPLRK